VCLQAFQLFTRRGAVIPAETKDAMQQAVRDALIAFMAATTAQARAHATKAVQRARGATIAEAELCLRRQKRHAEF
jgi:hypothetical protein